MTATRDHGDVYSATCPCRPILDLLADKWSALIIGALEDGPLRFGELKVRLQGVSPKVLTAALRRLENGGFLTRTVLPEVPLHVEYELTELGRGASEPLASLRTWVEENLEQFGSPTS